MFLVGTEPHVFPFSRGQELVGDHIQWIIEISPSSLALPHNPRRLPRGLLDTCFFQPPFSPRSQSLCRKELNNTAIAALLSVALCNWMFQTCEFRSQKWQFPQEDRWPSRVSEFTSFHGKHILPTWVLSRIPLYMTHWAHHITSLTNMRFLKMVDPQSSPMGFNTKSWSNDSDDKGSPSRDARWSAPHSPRASSTPLRGPCSRQFPTVCLKSEHGYLSDIYMYIYVYIFLQHSGDLHSEIPEKWLGETAQSAGESSFSFIFPAVNVLPFQIRAGAFKSIEPN